MLNLEQLKAALQTPMPARDAAAILGVPVYRIHGWMLSGQVHNHALPDGEHGVTLSECKAVLKATKAAVTRITGNGPGAGHQVKPERKERGLKPGACWAWQADGKAVPCAEMKAVRFSTGLGFSCCGEDARCPA